MRTLFWPLSRNSNLLSDTVTTFWFIEIIRLSYSTYHSGNSMQSKNYEHTILTVIPQLKRDL